MDYNDKLIEEAVLALLAAFSSDDGNAWKGFDFEVDTKKKVLLSKTFFQSPRVSNVRRALRAQTPHQPTGSGFCRRFGLQW